MPIETIPGTDIRYHLVSLDADGKERTEDPDGRMSERIVRALQADAPSDVFVFIHGWKGDVDAARKQYAAWISTLMHQAQDLEHARANRPGFRPLLVGLHWPSLPFGDESFGEGTSFAVGVGTESGIESAIDDAAEKIADTPTARVALRTIFEAAGQNEFTPSSLPPAVAEAYRILDRESGLSADGVEGDPGSDRETFDPDKAYALGTRDAASFGGGGARKALLSPLVQLSFWKMKARARRIGESGGFGLLSTLMQASSPDVRFHIMGHSFGCIAACASACGPAQAKLPRPVHSMVLVQGALSLWSCSDRLPGSANAAGYFRRLASGGVVAGPIVTTRSKHDMAVGSLYPIAAGVARQVSFAPGELPKYGRVGTFGLRGSGLNIEDLTAGAADFPYVFKSGGVYNVDCDSVIREGSPPSGAHSDIARPEIGHLVWAAALTSP